MEVVICDMCKEPMPDPRINDTIVEIRFGAVLNPFKGSWKRIHLCARHLREFQHLDDHDKEAN